MDLFEQPGPEPIFQQPVRGLCSQRWGAAAFGRGPGRRIAAVAALALVALLLSLTPGASAAADLEDHLWDLQIIPLDGEEPPGFTLEGLQGKPVSLRDLRGRAVFVYFWATW